ncbi:hypothetical protein QUB56_04830 [Microcoleus sp. AR_TQ3_B6]|uniref:hypothetical protein n=1 Tax=Microcoleus sp. AR_TQ3_B6 TaxID=3055284 RepID=UPI002FD5601C
MNLLKYIAIEYIDFLIATQKAYSCCEADRVQPATGSAAAHYTLNHNCEVPAANLLGKECLGMGVFSSCMEWKHGLILASAIGGMESRKSGCSRKL